VHDRYSSQGGLGIRKPISHQVRKSQVHQPVI